VGRLMGRPSSDGDRHRRSGRKAISQAAWDLSSILGRVALGIVCLVLIVTVIRQTPSIRDKLLTVLPRPIADFLRDDQRTPAPRESKIDEIRSRVAGSVLDDSKTARTDQKGGTRPRAFGMGSTKRDVTLIQGTPTRRTENTWFYGESEVYFAGDRVVGWRNAPRNPLRVE
jgi:hypothetical protein